MMPETGRLTIKKMVYLFVYIRALTYNITYSTARLFSLIFRCMYYFELLLNRYKTLLSQQQTPNKAKYV